MILVNSLLHHRISALLEIMGHELSRKPLSCQAFLRRGKGDVCVWGRGGGGGGEGRLPAEHELRRGRQPAGGRSTCKL